MLDASSQMFAAGQFETLRPADQKRKTPGESKAEVGMGCRPIPRSPQEPH
jgi:hypothetical protein